jgi:hypothetical protein
MIEEQTPLACIHCAQEICQDRFGVWYHPGTGATTCAPQEEPPVLRERPSSYLWSQPVEEDADYYDEPLRRWWSRELHLPRWGYMLGAVLFLVAGIFVGRTT